MVIVIIIVVVMIAMSIIPTIGAVVVVLVVVVVSVIAVVVEQYLIALGYIVTAPLVGVGKTEKQRKSVCVCEYLLLENCLICIYEKYYQSYFD